MSKQHIFKVFALSCAVSLSLQSCFPDDFFLPTNSGSSSGVSNSIFDDLFNPQSEEILYEEGELIDQEENFDTLSAIILA